MNLPSSNQEIFDIVSAHLLSQGRKSKGKGEFCKYRSYDGSKCAVGCLIPDDLYSEDIEGHDLYSEDIEGNGVCALAEIYSGKAIASYVEEQQRQNTENGIVLNQKSDEYKQLARFLSDHHDFLFELQVIHDHHDPDRWFHLLKGLAIEKHLNFILPAASQT